MVLEAPKSEIRVLADPALEASLWGGGSLPPSASAGNLVILAPSCSTLVSAQAYRAEYASCPVCLCSS